jgi:hypothetical protein
VPAPDVIDVFGAGYTRGVVLPEDELLANEKIYRLKTDSVLEGKESILLSVK